MLTVTLNEDRFSYDIHSLVQAFYPGREVKVFVEGSRAFVSDADLPSLHVFFYEDRIEASLLPPGEMKDAGAIRETAALPAPLEKRAVKNALKHLLYHMLSGYTGKELPWGSLTGIRPVKIAMGLLEEGRTAAEIEAYMQKTYDCSRQKSTLSVQIAERERGILSRLHDTGYSLYLGIPFCPTTCLYCSFTSFPIAAWRNQVEAYLAALEREIDFVGETCRGRVLDSLYIGGGTPTTLEPFQLERLLEKLEKTLDLSRLLEFTVEAGRADSITPEKLQVLRRHGVNRISVNPQTMQEETLRLIGRQHTVEQVKTAFHMARQAGFENINMDLILGLPGEGEAEVAATLEAVKELDPDNVTIHSLAIKRGSKLHAAMLQKQAFSLVNSDAIMKIAAEGARDMGMTPYYLYRQKNMTGNFENVGYAKPGKAGVYNVLIMEEVQDIMALGAGSISKKVTPQAGTENSQKAASQAGDEDSRKAAPQAGESVLIQRCENVKEVAQYIERIDEMIERKRNLFGDSRAQDSCEKRNGS